MQNFSNSQSMTTMARIYLDYNATTPHSPELRSSWAEFINIYGNPSSIHQDSRLPKSILRETRQKIAELLQCSPLELVFNSGASEGNNSVLKAVFAAVNNIPNNMPNNIPNNISNNTRNEFLVSQVEHPSVLKTTAYLQAQGAVVHYIPVNRNGDIDLNFIKEKLSDRTALVSVMYANNETGVIFPVKEIARLAHSVGALMHSDCVQTLGKVTLNFKELDVDYATFSAHKFYALKGTGFCYIKKSAHWSPLIHGGGQERNRRGGTENIIGLAALNVVLDQLKNTESHITEMSRLKNLFEELVMQNILGLQITASKSNRLCNTSSLVIADIDGETLLMTLDLKGYAVSTGAACSSGNPEPSPVLLAMGLTRAEAQSSLRISLGWYTTEKEIRQFAQVLADTVSKLRGIHFVEKNFAEKRKSNEHSKN